MEDTGVGIEEIEGLEGIDQIILQAFNKELNKLLTQTLNKTSALIEKYPALVDRLEGAHVYIQFIPKKTLQ